MMAEKTANRLPQTEQKASDRGLLDLPFLLLTVILVSIGVIMMYSASYPRAFQEEGNGMYYFIRQAIFAVVGILVMLGFSRINYQIWRRFAFSILGASIVLLILVLIIGRSGGGAKRWIYIGPISIQPSELAKFGVVVSFSGMIAGLKDKIRTLKYGVMPFVIMLVPIVLLLALEPHLSAIVIICLTAAALLYLGGLPGKWFLMLFAAAAVFIGAYLALRGYASDRITAWLHPEDFAQTKGYQVLQSLYAIGSGGLFGLGFGKSRQKYLYLPEEHNDYIFSIVCEELGFVGAALIILLFALLIIRGYWIAMHAPDRFGKLVAAGLTTLLALQVALNIGVVSNVLPSTGISLPFFSYGGTALLVQLAEMGIVLNISRSCKNNLL